MIREMRFGFSGAHFLFRCFYSFNCGFHLLVSFQFFQPDGWRLPYFRVRYIAGLTGNAHRHRTYVFAFAKLYFFYRFGCQPERNISGFFVLGVPLRRACGLATLGPALLGSVSGSYSSAGAPVRARLPAGYPPAPSRVIHTAK